MAGGIPPEDPHAADPDAELAALRARAYGRGADIGSDPDAVARLRELEARAKHAGQARQASPSVSPDAAAAGRTPTADTEPAPTLDAGVETGREAEAAAGARHPSASRATSWWRRPLTMPVALWAAAGVVLLAVGAALGGVAPAVGGSGPTATRSISPMFDRAELPSMDLDSGTLRLLQVWDARATSLRMSEPFGNLRAVTARSRNGMTCMLMTAPPPDSDGVMGGGLYGGGCAPVGADPVLDVQYSSDSPWTLPEGSDVDDGSWVRFIVHRGVLQVWISPAADRS